MNKYFSLLLLGLLLGHSISAQDAAYPASSIAPALLKQAHSVVRQRTMVVEVDQDYSVTIETQQVVTILNKSGMYNAYIYEQEDELTSVKKISGVLYAEDGTVIRENSKDDIKTFSNDDSGEITKSKKKLLAMESNTYPFTVALRTVVKEHSFFRLPIFEVQRLGESVESAEFILKAPKGFEIDWKAYNCTATLLPVQEKGHTVWACKWTNLNAKPAEVLHPYFRTSYAQLIVTPVKVRYGDVNGSMKDWAGASRFFYDLNKDRDELSPAFQEKIKTMTAKASNNREKLAILYRYMQDNCRYVSIQLGIGGYQTLTADFVEDKKYGDCKALSNFMKAMLKVVGIPAYQALVFGNDDEYPGLQPDFVTPLFNHVILYVPGEEVWLECTSNTAPFGYLGEFTAGHPALLLMPEGGQLVQIPVLEQAQNYRHLQATVQMDSLGNAKIQTVFHYGGALHDTYRSLSQEKDKAAKDKRFAEGLGVSVKVFDQLEFSAHAEMPNAEVRADFQTRNYAKLNGKRLFVPISKVKPFEFALPVDTARVHPVHIGEAYVLLDTFTFFIPKGYKVENFPALVDEVSEFGAYRLEISPLEGQQLKAIRRIEIKQFTLPATEYVRMQAFFAKIKKADAAQLVLVRT